MELIIDIDEDVRIAISRMGLLRIPDEMLKKVDKAIQNGKPLPKGHGRLIDADRLKSMYSINQANFNTVVGIQKWIDDAPTIIEKDKEQEE